jgi:geranylgeranyl diphosphate synthase type II
MLAYSLFKNNLKGIVPYAVAVEAFHNFTLMHDDIMDKAPVRRGKPTVHKKWNLSTAILSGDVMLVKVYEQFCNLEPKNLKDIIIAFNQCATQVCEGQQWDMEFENMNHVDEAAYINMIKLKTAVLLGFSLELGGMIAGVNDESRKALRAFGTNIGIGFQLKDDLLDAYADPKKFGKQLGGDIIANKKTFLLIKALEKASGKQKTELHHWLTVSKFNKKEKVEAVKEIYDALNIPNIIEQKVNYYFKQGFKSLEKITPVFDASTLRDFTQSMIARQV